MARAAYEGYRAHTGGISLATGQSIPEWDHLPDAIRDAWCAAVVAVREALANDVRVAIEDAGYRIRERLFSE